MKTAKEKAGVLRSLQGTLREIKQIKKSRRDQAEADIEKTCEVFINALYRVSYVKGCFAFITSALHTVPCWIKLCYDAWVRVKTFNFEIACLNPTQRIDVVMYFLSN